jgi:TRAP transporter TAXI family solute receptor
MNGNLPFYRSTRYIPLLLLTAVLAGLAVFVWMIFTVWHPMPPRVLVMTTGGEGGDYFEYGKRYRDFLKKNGIEVRLLPSAGAYENLRRLRDPNSGVSAGFVPAGITSEGESPELISLGTLFYEPLWFFYRDRGLSPVRMLKGLRGKSLSIGPEGSASRQISLELLALNRIAMNDTNLVSLSPKDAEDQLIQGKIEAAVMMASWESPTVRRLLVSENIRLLNFPRADTYVAIYPYLNKVVVPAGLGNLARNFPPENVQLLAPKTSLVVRRELHSALQYLLLDAAQEIHGTPGVFQKAGQFPAAEAFDLPLGDKALHFYKSGRPFLQRYLPFWLAVLAQQLLVLVIPLLGILYPLFRFMPGLYSWGMRHRIYRLYGELKFLEAELEQRGPAQDTGDLTARLNQLEERADHVHLPQAFTYMVYTLKHHISLVREKLEKRRAP